MQSCTIHHCVLFFCTLTFTSVPTLAVTRVKATLHQAVKLPCNYKCAGRGRWTMFQYPDNVLAECDQTSCRTRDGYNMFYDEYQQGELSLTITTADYSKRGLYTCDCDGKDIDDVRLSIETLKSSVELNPGEVLLMDLPVPQPVAVIYKARDSPALYGEQICTVTHQLLQCKTKYTPRTSLTYTTLTLRDVNITDSGIYTIRDLKNKEDIHIYTLTLKEMQRINNEKSVNVLWILPVLILVMVVIITGIVCFIKIRSKRVKKQQMEQQEQERLLHEQEQQRLIQHHQEQQRLLRPHQEHERLLRPHQEHERLLHDQEHERLLRPHQEQQRLIQHHQEQQRLLHDQEQQHLLHDQEHERLLHDQEHERLLRPHQEHERLLRPHQEHKRLLRLLQEPDRSASLNYVELEENQLPEKETAARKRRVNSEADLKTLVHKKDGVIFAHTRSAPIGSVQTVVRQRNKEDESKSARSSYSETYRRGQK